MTSDTTEYKEESHVHLLETIMDDGLRNERNRWKKHGGNRNGCEHKTKPVYQTCKHSSGNECHEGNNLSSGYTSVDSENVTQAQSEFLGRAETLFSSTTDDQGKLHKDEKVMWKRAAMVLDRLFFILFLICLFVTICWCFGKSPGYVP